MCALKFEKMSWMRKSKYKQLEDQDYDDQISKIVKDEQQKQNKDLQLSSLIEY